MYTLTVAFVEGSTTEGWGEILGRFQSVRNFRIIGEELLAHAPILFDSDWMTKEGSDWQII